MNNLFNDELLFFGSMTTNFAYHPGSVHWFDDYSFHDQPHSETSDVSSQENDAGQQLEIPRLPTTSIHVQAKNCPTPNELDLFHRPLVKTKESSHLTGLVSGVRSALIKTKTNQWYRLKGCGNNTDGFLIQSVENSPEKSTIRGCAFLHTIHRELYMTEQISQLFTSHHIDCANSSVGWFEYNSSKESSENDLSSDVPTVIDVNLHRWSNVTRGCIVMKTLANKRLSDHVLFGIEQLFSLIISDHLDSHPVDLSALLTAFPSHRLTQSEENATQLTPLATWFVALDSTLGPLASRQLSWLDNSSRLSNDIPTSVDNRWTSLWKTNRDILNEYLKTNTLSDLFYLIYRRFGYECGAILGLLHYHRISWGTYNDALGTHCNAHLNNMVIKLPAENFDSTRFFLAPLDFDMSFTEGSCEYPFNELMIMELLGFRLAIGGDSNLNTGMTAWASMSDVQWLSARWFLRDVMLSHFDQTYDEVIRTGSIPSFDPLSNEQIYSIYSLIRLALIRTINEIS